ncbi:MAG: DUF711 family protein [Ignisphaera sp.]
MALIRALALHIPIIKHETGWIVKKSTELLDRTIICCKNVGSSPWTWRIVLPPLPTTIEYQNVKKMVLEISSSFSNIGVLIAIPFKMDSPYIDRIIDLIYENDNVYSSISCNDELCIDRVIDRIYGRARNTDINVYTNFAIAFGSWMESPYFPATANVSNTVGVSCSLRYADLIKKSLVDGNGDIVFEFVTRIDNLLESLSKCVGIPYLGMDLSLSPWLSESVAEIVEFLVGDRMGSIGSFNAIYVLNAYIRRLMKSAGVKTIGYNEVMLPVAEDLLLNERVGKGDVKLRDLMSFSIFCVPGVDMVAMPHYINYRRFLLDMLAIYEVKKTNTALRVIPTDLESGTRIILKRFGETYVVYT